MGNKTIPDEVVTAMELAKAAGWPVSNRNKFVRIYPPGENIPPITIGHKPNDESMKVFRSICRTYNLHGQGPARTREEVEALMKAAEAEGQKLADQRNAQRKAYEAEQKKKQAEIEAARQKAAAAIQQGMTPQEDTTTMPKTSKIEAKPVSTLESHPFPVFDAALVGTKDNSKFLLPSKLYYCIECWETGQRATFKAPQGLAAHRSRWHQLYNETPKTQETSRVSLPADVDTAFDMLRSALAEALGETADSETLAAKDAELAELRAKLEAATKQADGDRGDFDKRFLEAQVSADKKLKDLREELEAKRKTEVDDLTREFYTLLKSIQSTAEQLPPIQAIAKIDEIVRSFAG